MIEGVGAGGADSHHIFAINQNGKGTRERGRAAAANKSHLGPFRDSFSGDGGDGDLRGRSRSMETDVGLGLGLISPSNIADCSLGSQNFWTKINVLSVMA